MPELMESGRISSRLNDQITKEDTMNKPNSKKRSELLQRRDAPLETRTDLTQAATKDITAAMNAILADVFALYVKTDRKSTRLNSSHSGESRMPSSA